MDSKSVYPELEMRSPQYKVKTRTDTGMRSLALGLAESQDRVGGNFVKYGWVRD